MDKSIVYHVIPGPKAPKVHAIEGCLISTAVSRLESVWFVLKLAELGARTYL